jgi:hypothetical protein
MTKSEGYRLPHSSKIRQERGFRRQAQMQKLPFPSKKFTSGRKSAPPSKATTGLALQHKNN